MILSKIVKKVSLPIFKFNQDINFLKTKKSFLINLKETKRLTKLYKLNLEGLKKSSFPRDGLNGDYLISYVINIKVTNSNVLLTFTDTKGKVFYSYTAGNANLKGKQKNKTLKVSRILINHLLVKLGSKKDKPVALHFINVKPGLQKFITKTLKTKVFIKLIKVSDLHPYNGCRPKKLRRKR